MSNSARKAARRFGSQSLSPAAGPLAAPVPPAVEEVLPPVPAVEEVLPPAPAVEEVLPPAPAVEEVLPPTLPTETPEPVTLPELQLLHAMQSVEQSLEQQLDGLLAESAVPVAEQPATRSMSSWEEELLRALDTVDVYGELTVAELAQFAGFGPTRYAKLLIDRYVSQGLLQRAWRAGAGRYTLSAAGKQRLASLR